MKKTIQLLDRPLKLTIDSTAERLLGYRDQPLHVEMKLYFSCLIRKQVSFPASMNCNITTRINKNLIVGFRPVMTKICNVDSCNNEPPPVTDFPIVQAERYIPHWLSLTYNGDNWQGEFGYC